MRYRAAGYGFAAMVKEIAFYVDKAHKRVVSVMRFLFQVGAYFFQPVFVILVYAALLFYFVFEKVKIIGKTSARRV
jgi:hypothetical protein